MDTNWVELIHLYFPLSVAILAQLVFLLLPINLQTWRKDSLSATTYTAIQTLVAAVLFAVVPREFELFSISPSGTFISVLIVFIASWWKVILTIPLEAKLHVNAEYQPLPNLDFEGFYTADRLRALGGVDSSDPQKEHRLRSVREMLVRRRVDKNLDETEDV
ncbi:MAG: hypothetical protein RJB13_54 [Pseudomonadota bacterium]|jgi:hypothetical protein